MSLTAKTTREITRKLDKIHTVALFSDMKGLVTLEIKMKHPKELDRALLPIYQKFEKLAPQRVKITEYLYVRIVAQSLIEK